MKLQNILRVRLSSGITSFPLLFFFFFFDQTKVTLQRDTKTKMGGIVTFANNLLHLLLKLNGANMGQIVSPKKDRILCTSESDFIWK